MRQRVRKTIVLTGRSDKCTVCSTVKDVAEFVVCRSRPRGYVRECLDCRRERNHKRQYSKKQIYNGPHNWHSTPKNRELVSKAKNRPCMDCGIQYPPYVMDFDHVRGQKMFNLSRANGRSLQDVLDEMAKCDIVCANCHRIRTWG